MTFLEPLDPLPGRRSGEIVERLADSGTEWALRSKVTVEHQIAEVLREKIIVGEIARGQKLKQAEIAKMLGVSITPVREALRLLEAQGYVAVSAHRGAVVAPFLIEGAEELYELRMILVDAVDTRGGEAVEARGPEPSQGPQSRCPRRGEDAHAPIAPGERISGSISASTSSPISRRRSIS